MTNAEGKDALRQQAASWLAQLQRLAEESGVPLKEIVYDGYSPLMLAAMANNLDLINKLLDQTVDPNALGPNGKTAVDLAVNAENAEAVKVLRARGAEKNTDTTSPQHDAPSASRVRSYTEILNRATYLPQRAGTSPPIPVPPGGSSLPRRPVSPGPDQ